MARIIFSIFLYVIALITLTVKLPLFFISDVKAASLMIIGIYAACLLAVLILYRKELSEMYKPAKFNFKWFVWLAGGLIAILLVQLINGIVLVLLGTELMPMGESIYDWIKDHSFIIVLPLILAPIFEELIFRGIIFESSFKKSDNFWVAGLLSSSLFAVIHFNSINALAYFLTGIMFAYLFKKRGLLLVTIVHILLNLSIITINLQ